MLNAGHRRKKEIKRAQWPCQREGDGKGIANGNVLRCQLAKDNVQKSNSDEGQRD